jgi:hypothetical protein
MMAIPVMPITLPTGPAAHNGAAPPIGQRVSPNVMVDAQTAKLRRIERCLHDGAQARLAAVGMALGLALSRRQASRAASSVRAL